MAEHYYSQRPSGKSDERQHNIIVANQTLNLWTDHGVFSKGGLDFGSRTLLETVATQNYSPSKILDVGCGYGPIGLTLAKLYPTCYVDMVDVNERAIALANKNAQANRLSHCRALQSNLYEKVESTDYALIVSNPPIRAGKQVVHQIISESINYLTQGGALIIVIQKKQGAPSAEKKMLEVFGNVERLAKDKGYYILQSIKGDNA